MSLQVLLSLAFLLPLTENEKGGLSFDNSVFKNIECIVFRDTHWRGGWRFLNCFQIVLLPGKIVIKSVLSGQSS